MKKIEIQMLLYILTKHFIEVQENMLNPFDIILFYILLCMFDGEDIGVKTRGQSLIPLTNIYYVEYIYSYIYMCVKYIIPRWR